MLESILAMLPSDLTSRLLLGLIPSIAVLAGAVGYYLRKRSDASVVKAASDAAKAQAEAANTASLWQTLGRLEQRIVGLEKDLTRERFLKHQWRNVAGSLHLEKLILCTEVNGLLEDLGKKPQYVIHDIRAPYIDESDPLHHHPIPTPAATL